MLCGNGTTADFGGLVDVDSMNDVLFILVAGLEVCGARRETRPQDGVMSRRE
jgi:hypothetical protein